MINPLKLFADYLDRAKSHIYGIFAFWVAFFNLQIIFTALFVDQKLLYEKTGMLKNEYIRNTYLNIYDWKDLTWGVGGLILAAVFTYLMIWVLPKKLIKRAYSEELDNQYEREFMKVEKEEELLNRRKKLVKEEEQVVSRQAKLEAKESDEWDKEYEKFKASNLFSDFDGIAQSIARYNSGIKHYNRNGNLIFRIDEGLLTYSYGNGLLDLVGSNKDEIELTDKGKYFLAKFQIDNATE
jgi:hypothetical protein